VGLLLKSLVIAMILFILTGCVRPSKASPVFQVVDNNPQADQADQPNNAHSSRTPFLPPTRVPGSPVYTPTPDAPHALPTPRKDADTYTVQGGDTLGNIAQRYGVDLNSIVQANNLTNPDILSVGQVLDIPAPPPLPPGPDFKVIPDSELVDGPAAAFFDVNQYIQDHKGYLASYHDEVSGETKSGAQVVAQVAREYSVNPRLLLAVLEYQSGWLTQPDSSGLKNVYPAGFVNTSYQGLYKQLSWVANNLNRGYYLWKVGGIAGWILADGKLVPPAATLNAGTAGVQHLFSLLYDQADWEKAVGEKGLFATYNRLFGYPFDLAIEPLIPPDLKQPAMQLPFEAGTTWSFTGGPHGGWGGGSAWAALDFAPPGDAFGCVTSDAWVVAVTDGLIVRSEYGEVVEDLDEDGYEQTGWTVLYMHIETRDRVSVGDHVKAGERIGHPSCEGGVSNGTHVHLARRYNGEWISADGSLPYNLEGWISKGNGKEYDGWLVRGDQTVEAWDARKDENQIHR
jgi:murein DD-endopeptidase MepM/ murein hydrolase activator NlpD